MDTPSYPNMLTGLKIPVMTRRGVIECRIGPEGYVVLPDWVGQPEPANGTHELDLVAEMSVSGQPVVRCRGGSSAVVEKLKQETAVLREKAAKAEDALAEAHRKLSLWRKQETSRRNLLHVQGLFNNEFGIPESKNSGIDID